jgi:hypothetical protein
MKMPREEITDIEDKGEGKHNQCLNENTKCYKDIDSPHRICRDLSVCFAAALTGFRLTKTIQKYRFCSFSHEGVCTYCLYFLIFYSSLHSSFPWLLCCTTPGILPFSQPVASPPMRPTKPLSIHHCIQSAFLVVNSQNLCQHSTLLTTSSS